MDEMWLCPAPIEWRCDVQETITAKSGSSGGTNTVTEESNPPADVTAAYNQVQQQATNVSAQPLQQYAGPLVAGFTPDQLSAMSTVDNSTNVANPYINSASQLESAGSAPITPSALTGQDINQYLSPYLNEVGGSTEAQLGNLNAQQNQQLVGNAISSGAWGGDRSAVAQSDLAGQQALNEAPTLANIYNTGYGQAVSTATGQQATGVGAQEATGWLTENAGSAEGALGTEAQNTALSGANAQLQTGGLQQQLAQEQLNIPYEQFQQEQAYPFQTTSYDAGIAEGIGSASGGTSSTSYPGASTLSQLGGLGLTGIAGYGLYNDISGAGNAASTTSATGGRIHRDSGGGVGISVNGLPTVPNLSQGNMTLYSSPTSTAITGPQTPSGIPPIPNVDQGPIPPSNTAPSTPSKGSGPPSAPAAPGAAAAENPSPLQQGVTAINTANLVGKGLKALAPKAATALPGSSQAAATASAQADLTPAATAGAPEDAITSAPLDAAPATSGVMDAVPATDAAITSGAGLDAGLAGADAATAADAAAGIGAATDAGVAAAGVDAGIAAAGADAGIAAASTADLAPLLLLAARGGRIGHYAAGGGPQSDGAMVTPAGATPPSPGSWGGGMGQWGGAANANNPGVVTNGLGAYPAAPSSVPQAQAMQQPHWGQNADQAASGQNAGTGPVSTPTPTAAGPISSYASSPGRNIAIPQLQSPTAAAPLNINPTSNYTPPPVGNTPVSTITYPSLTNGQTPSTIAANAPTFVNAAPATTGTTGTTGTAPATNTLGTTTTTAPATNTLANQASNTLAAPPAAAGSTALTPGEINFLDMNGYGDGTPLPTTIAGYNEAVQEIETPPPYDAGFSARGGRLPHRDDGGDVSGSAVDPTNLQSYITDTLAQNLAYQAKGGRVHRDMGGATQAGAISAGIPGAMGASPIQAGLYSKLSQLPPEKLQELSVRMPPTTPQGQLVQRALQVAKMNPQTAAAPPGGALAQPATGPAASPISGASPLGSLATGGRLHRDDGGAAEVVDPNTGVVGPSPIQIAPEPTRAITAPPPSAIIPVIADAAGAHAEATEPGRTAMTAPPRPDMKPSRPSAAAPAPAAMTAPPAATRATPAESGDNPATFVSPYTPERLPARTLSTSEKMANSPWMALLQTGLATMAGRSPYALQNLGAGAEQGVKVLGEQAQSAQAQRKEAAAEEAQWNEAQKGQVDTQIQGQRVADQLWQAKNLARTEQQNAQTNQDRATNESTNQAGMLAARNREIDIQSVPPDVRAAQWFQNATPEQKQAYTSAALAKQGMVLGGAGGPGSTGPNGQPLTGDAYLATLDPKIATQVKAYADGRMPFPSGYALRAPYFQQMLQAVGQYDPSFDAVNYNSRNKTRGDFTSGASAKNVTSLNTVMGHMEALKGDFDTLGNQGGMLTPLNAPANWLQSKTGNPAQTNIAEDAGAVASELRKVFATTGGGGLTELEQWQSTIPLNGSPEQQKEWLNHGMTLLDSRINALGDQYNRGMGKTEDPLNLLSPKARDAYLRLTGRQEQSGTAATSEGPHAAVPATQAAPSVIRYDAQGNRVQ